MQVLFLICFSNTTYGLNVVDDCQSIVSASRPSIQIFKTVQLLNMGLILSGLGQCFSNYAPRHTNFFCHNNFTLAKDSSAEPITTKLGSNYIVCLVVVWLNISCVSIGVVPFLQRIKVPKIDSKGPISSIFYRQPSGLSIFNFKA